MLKMYHLTSFFFKFKFNLLVKSVFLLLLNAAFAVAFLDLFHVYILHNFLLCSQVVEIFHILQLFLSYRSLNWRWLYSYSHSVRFLPHSFLFRCIFQFQLGYHSRPVTQFLP